MTIQWQSAVYVNMPRFGSEPAYCFATRFWRWHLSGRSLAACQRKSWQNFFFNFTIFCHSVAFRSCFYICSMLDSVICMLLSFSFTFYRPSFSFSIRWRRAC